MSSLFVSDPETYKKLKYPFSILILTLMGIAFINGLFTTVETHKTTQAFISSSEHIGDTLKIVYKFHLGRQEFVGNHILLTDTFKHDPNKLFLLKPYVTYLTKDPNNSQLRLNKEK